MKRPTTQQQQQKHNNRKTILRGCAAARMAAQPKNTWYFLVYNNGIPKMSCHTLDHLTLNKACNFTLLFSWHFLGSCWWKWWFFEFEFWNLHQFSFVFWVLDDIWLEHAQNDPFEIKHHHALSNLSEVSIDFDLCSLVSVSHLLAISVDPIL